MNTLVQNIIGSVLSEIAGNSAQNSQLLQSLASAFLKPDANGSAANGLAGIVQQFEKNGLGNVVASWIGTGVNMAVTPEQVEQALGAQQVQDIAKQAGVSSMDAPNVLAQILPQLINQITPNGTMDHQMIGQVLNAFLNGKKAA